jgi:hypothetical protein
VTVKDIEPGDGPTTQHVRDLLPLLGSCPAAESLSHNEIATMSFGRCFDLCDVVEFRVSKWIAEAAMLIFIIHSGACSQASNLSDESRSEFHLSKEKLPEQYRSSTSSNFSLNCDVRVFSPLAYSCNARHPKRFTFS